MIVRDFRRGRHENTCVSYNQLYFDQPFFAFAAGLIPLLLFGGVVADRWKPPPSTRREWPWQCIAVVVVLVAAVAVEAEVVAVRVSIVGASSKSDRVLVAAVVVLATASVVLTIAWPWAKRLGRYGHPAAVIALLTVGATSVTPLEHAIASHARDQVLAQLEQLSARISEDRRRVQSDLVRLGRENGALHAAKGSPAYVDRHVTMLALGLDQAQEKDDSGIYDDLVAQLGKG